MTKIAPHLALQLITRGKLTFDERVVLQRVERVKGTPACGLRVLAPHLALKLITRGKLTFDERLLAKGTFGERDSSVWTPSPGRQLGNSPSITSDTMYQSNGFRKSIPQQNRQPIAKSTKLIVSDEIHQGRLASEMVAG